MQGDEQYAECIISQSAVPLPTVLHHSTTTTVLFAIPCHPLSARAERIAHRSCGAGPGSWAGHSRRHDGAGQGAAAGWDGPRVGRGCCSQRNAEMLSVMPSKA